MANSALNAAVAQALTFQPGGRLTLTSATPVMIAEVANAAAVYYTPYLHDLVPIYNGTTWNARTFTELTLTLHATPHVSGNNYDVFIFDNAGTLTLGTGPAWTSATARGTGAGTTELERKNGRLTNKVAIDLKNSTTTYSAVAANTALYLGTFRTNGNGTTTWELGGAAAGGDAINLFLWNMYNRVDVGVGSYDSTDSWVYAVATWRSMNNSTLLRATYVCGLADDCVSAYTYQYCATSISSYGSAGIGVDATNATTGLVGLGSISAATNQFPISAEYRGRPGLGMHYLQALEIAGSGSSVTFYGDATSVLLQTGMQFTGKF